ncbi:MAG TPA: M13-type metalloendopeptidase [bacterium]|nr:M13-type metalloendopeptidase [bacterium]
MNRTPSREPARAARPFRPIRPVLALLLLLLGAPAGASEYAPHIGEFGFDLTGRDETVRPQDDFFRYSNGQWLEEFEIPEDLSGYGSFTKLFLESEEQVREIIEDAAAAHAEPGTVEQKVGDLFADFVNQEAVEAAGLTPLEADFDRILAADTHTDVLRLLGHYERVGGTTPFNYYIGQDEKDPERYLVHFVQSGLGLPDREYYLDDSNERFATAKSVYREYLEKMFTLAERDAPGPRAQAILSLETRLAEAHWKTEDTRDLDKTYNVMTKQSLTELAPHLPWDVYLEALGLEEIREFVVEEPSAYAGMAQVFMDTPVEIWQDYLIYRLLRNNAALLPRAIDRTHFEFTSVALSGAKEQRERWKRGVQFINGTIGEAVGQLYVERHFPPEAKESIDELVGNLMLAFEDRLGKLPWMTEDTRVQALEKLRKFTVKIGYPDHWKDFSSLEVVPGDLVGNARRASLWFSEYQRGKLTREVDRHEWFLSPQTVNAYYNPGLNEIVFPAAILQPPFFDPHADDAVNYGAIGAVIGHEIGHGFDDQGRKMDGDGMMRDWWNEEDASRFQERADMLVEQYNGFEALPGMNVNGELTLGENIGDLGGLEIAYHAYRISLDGQEAPVIDGLTGDQRFFLGFSQIWRGKYRDELMAQLVAADPHSPLEFRVNGTLANMDAWYAAFDVEEGDSMYLSPDDRVRIW